MTNEALLKLENVRVWFEMRRGLFGKKLVVKAVDGVDLELRKGSSIVLVGESGCGKTTLGRTAIGLIKPTHGRVLYKGKDIWTMPKEDYRVFRRNAQIVHQDPYTCLNPTKTVFQILYAPLRRWGIVSSREEGEEYVRKLLEEVGLVPPEEYLHRYPHQLSGGERQRVSIARALSVRPEIVLADEAVSAVDASIRIDLMNLLLKFREQYGTSYIFVTHDLAVARYFALRSRGIIAVMYLGVIVEQAPLDYVIKNALHPYTQALLAAVPEMDLERGEAPPPLPLKSLEVPSAASPPQGCRFHPRCPHAMERCRVREPPLEIVEKEHAVRCWLYIRK